MQAVYYSLVLTADRDRYEKQWIRSVESLRRFNTTVTVYLFLFDNPTPAILSAAHRCEVIIRNLGDYRDCLREIAGEEGEVLSRIPTLHKLLPLGCFDSDVSQLLFLDCDTFFFGDVARLFARYRECRLYAREEPHSRRSKFLEYRPSHIDEEALDRLAKENGGTPVAPWNSGVFLMNHGLHRELFVLRREFFSFAWRLSAGAIMSSDIAISPGLKREIAAIPPGRFGDPIVFPSANYWILEQIALWLTLGSVKNLTYGRFPMEDVVQNGEFKIYPSYRGKCTVVHYFGGNEVLFLQDRMSPDLETSGY